MQVQRRYLGCLRMAELREDAFPAGPNELIYVEDKRERLADLLQGQLGCCVGKEGKLPAKALPGQPLVLKPHSAA